MDTLQKFLDKEANKIVDWYTWGFESYREAIQDCLKLKYRMLSYLNYKFSASYWHEYYNKKFPYISKFIDDDWEFNKNCLRNVVDKTLQINYQNLESKIISICGPIIDKEFELSEYRYLICTYYCSIRDCIAFIFEIDDFTNIGNFAQFQYTDKYWHFVREVSP